MYYYETIQKSEIVEEVKKKEFVRTWLKDPLIRTYKFLDFAPCLKLPNNVYNLWNGWEASKLPKTTLKFEDSKIYQHMKYIYNEAFEFQCDKYAYMIQTGKKSDVCNVLSSDQGTGKDTTNNYIGNNILGKKYYLNEDYIDMLIGESFNDMISNKVLVVLNESKKAKLDDIMGAVKNAITREKNSIRAKFVKPREETNNITWEILTNSYDAVSIEKGDRRFLAIKITNEHKEDTKYFNELYEEINSKKYDRACYDFFNNRKIKIKNFQNERPITNYYKKLQEKNIPIIAQFLTQIMMKEKGELKLQATLFFNRYVNFLKENGFEYKTNSTKFGLELSQIAPIKKKNTKKCVMYEIQIDELRKYLIDEKFYIPDEQDDNDDDDDDDNDDDKDYDNGVNKQDLSVNPTIEEQIEHYTKILADLKATKLKQSEKLEQSKICKRKDYVFNNISKNTFNTEVVEDVQDEKPKKTVKKVKKVNVGDFCDNVLDADKEHDENVSFLF